MKNKESIEASLEEGHASRQAGDQPSSRADHIKQWRFKPGQSGNPGGRTKNDVAGEIARAVFEENKELMYKSMAKMLAKGSAFGFQVLSDRAYGKLTDKLEVTTADELVEKINKGMKRLASE